MDKGCGTCAHWGTPSYKSPCSECVASGTFSGWEARTCENCTNRFLMGLENGPCKACFAGKVYSEWKGSPTDVELNAKDEQTDDAEKTCGSCAHLLKGGNEEPCKTCNGSSMWEHIPTDADLKAKDEPKGDTLISERMCVTCEHSEVGKDEEPCKTCIDSGNERSMWEPESKPESNPIRPAHYTECSLECIDVMLAVFGRRAVTDFCILNAFKYMWRYEHKNGLEDLQKAERYLAMATTFQMGDKEQENRIINMKAVLEVLMRRVSE